MTARPALLRRMTQEPVTCGPTEPRGRNDPLGTAGLQGPVAVLADPTVTLQTNTPSCGPPPLPYPTAGELLTILVRARKLQ